MDAYTPSQITFVVLVLFASVLLISFLFPSVVAGKTESDIIEGQEEPDETPVAARRYYRGWLVVLSQVDDMWQARYENAEGYWGKTGVFQTSKEAYKAVEFVVDVMMDCVP